MNDFSAGHLLKQEFSEWRSLFEGYARFYDTEINDEIAGNVWAWIHDSSHVVQGVGVREAGGSLIGFAHVRACPRPLAGKDIGFLDDMYLHPDYRGLGAADVLFEGVERVAVAEQWSAVRWITQHFNRRGRAFYDRYVEGPTDFIVYQKSLV